MDGFSVDSVDSCYDGFVILVIACDDLLTQGADLHELYLYLFCHFLGFLLGVRDQSLLFLDEPLGGADLLFEFCWFFLKEVKSLDTSRNVSFGVQSRLPLVECHAPLSNVGFQKGLRVMHLYPVMCCFHLCPEEGKVAGWLELDPK